MITPDNDGTVNALLIYLQQYLNQQATSYYQSIGQPPAEAVVGLASVQSDLNSVLKLPLLACYRTSFSGEDMEYSAANIDYFPFTSVQKVPHQSGLFSWVCKHIAIALDNYNNMEHGCLRILPSQGSASIRYARIERKNGPLIIPFLRYPIEFEDFDNPA